MGTLDRSIVRLLAAAALAFAAAPAPAATITIVNLDGPSEGFNDPTSAAPVGGNPGTTVGAQRLFVFQHAANIWGSILPSGVEIRVNANFDPLSCSATSGVLGSAGPTQIWRDFAGAPVAGHWYHVALANKLAGSDLDAFSNDMTARFNSSIGLPSCLPSGWYYGIDGNEGGQIELLPVVLHELGHGLGFSTVTSGATGAYTAGFPAIWDRFLMDNALNLHWDQMTDAQRAASAVACNRLVWDGPFVTKKAPGTLGAKPILRVNSPGTIAGDYDVGLATFGPPLSTTGVTGDVVLVNDGAGSSFTDGCEPIVNSVAGRIALIDRGTCTFVTKVQNAQAAGAVGVIIADNISGCPPPGLGGTDPTITIPSVRVTLPDGNLIKSYLPGVNATMRRDPALLAGADGAGRVKMYSPSAFAGGSSVSHWDTSADPNLLMEPALSASLSSDVDLTTWLFADIGWFQELLSAPDPGPVAARLGANRPNPFSSSTAIHFTLERARPVELAVYDLAGRLVTNLHRGPLGEGAHVVRWDGRNADGRRAAPGIYLYRLRAGDLSETRHMVLFH